MSPIDHRAERERLKEQIKAEMMAEREAKLKAQRLKAQSAAALALAKLEALLPPEHPLARLQTTGNPVDTQNLHADAQAHTSADQNPDLSLDDDIYPAHETPQPKTLGNHTSHHPEP